MAYLNIKIPADAQNFNWDDIEVGNHHLDHSQNFFAQKHFKHERLDELEEIELVNEQLTSTHLNSVKVEDFPADNKENIINSESEVKGEATSPEDVLRPTQHQPLTISNTSNIAISECLEVSVANQNEQTSNPDVTLKPIKRPVNLAYQWSTQKGVASKALISSSGAIARPAPPPPHAYLIKDLYKRKKEEALRKRLEDERKMREFHSRPVPNYSAHHEQFERRKVVHAVTVPVTPLVLKKSLETEKKRKRKMEVWKKQNQPPKFESRSPNVLKEEPFVPKKVTTAVQPRPFNLRMEKRLEVRKQFDAAMLRAREEKEKQVEIEEEERRKRDEERVKELRKFTTFKARPNPFK